MARAGIRMLGGFCVDCSGQDVAQKLGAAKKRVTLLQYLILAQGRAVPVSELFAALWPYDDETLDQKGALKTTVSRLRAALAVHSRVLADAVLTETGGYAWDMQADVEVDVFEFEKLCRQISLCADGPNRAALCERALRLYRGDLLGGAAEEPWIARRSAELHAQYLAAAADYVRELRAENRFPRIAAVCREALAVDPLNSALSLDYMDALLHAGKPDEALNHYYTSAGARYRQLGETQPAEVLAFYSRLSRVDRESADGVRHICADLAAHTAGPLFCDYPHFREIYGMQHSAAARLGITLFVALITLSSRGDVPLAPETLEHAMARLENTLQGTLRASDAVTRYNTFRCAVLMAVPNAEGVRTAVERAKRVYYESDADADVVFSYTYAPVS